MESKDVVAVSARTARRRFSAQFKQELVEQALRPDVSLAAVALANGVNANQLSRWRREFLQQPTAAAFVPVRVIESTVASEPISVAVPNGEIEWRHGTTCLTIRGNVDTAVVRTIISQTLAASSR